MNKGTINDALSRCEELGYNYKMVRGLATVLESRANFQTKSVVSPIEARSKIFKEAGKRVIATDRDRLEILGKIAQDMEITIPELDESLYADLEDEQKMVKFQTPDPNKLLKYYNYSLTCAILSYAKKITLSFKGKDKQIEHIASPIGETQVEAEKYTQIKITLKPSKRLSQRGTKIDKLLSRLLQLPRWKITADVGYPQRYKNTVKLDLNQDTMRKLIEKDPKETETTIQI
jgi:predicted nuclease of restriction endonuclease-like RecB superfamily